LIIDHLAYTNKLFLVIFSSAARLV